MATARTKLRLTGVKYEGTTFEQQMNWWRETGKANISVVSKSKPFSDWIWANKDKLVRTVIEERKR